MKLFYSLHSFLHLHKVSKIIPRLFVVILKPTIDIIFIVFLVSYTYEEKLLGILANVHIFACIFNFLQYFDETTASQNDWFKPNRFSFGSKSIKNGNHKMISVDSARILTF